MLSDHHPSFSLRKAKLSELDVPSSLIYYANWLWGNNTQTCRDRRVLHGFSVSQLHRLFWGGIEQGMPSPHSELNRLLSFPAFPQCYGLAPVPRWSSHLRVCLQHPRPKHCVAFCQPSFPPQVSPSSSPVGDLAAQTLTLTLFDSVSFQPLSFKVRPGNPRRLNCTSFNALLRLHRGYQQWGEGGLRSQ